MIDRFEKLEFSHTAYNARRTLRNANPSQFEIANFNGLKLLKDSEIAFANQIWGLSDQTIGFLPQAMQIYDQLKMSPYLDVAAANLSAALKTQLLDMNFEMIEELNFLSIKLAEIEVKSPQINVEFMQPSGADDFLKLLKTSGMQTTNEIWQLKNHLYCTDKFRCFMAKLDGVPRAMATTYVDGKYGFLANAYTQADFQNQGCQTALLQARIIDAKQLGLGELLVDVVPNTSSERNCLKAGFKPLATRYIWQKKSPT